MPKENIDMKLRSLWIGASILLCAVIVAGCKVGPNYHTPSMDMPSKYGESTTRPTSQPAVDMTRWWDAFGDPMLDQLIQDAVEHNLTLKAAEARIRQARAQRGVVAADWWPTVNVNGSYAREKSQGRGSNTSNNPSNNTNSSGNNSGSSGNTSGNTGGNTSGNAGANVVSSRWGNLFNAGFDATWEIDVFGSVARNVEAADYDIQTAVEDRHDTLITLLAEVAVDYIDLRGAQRDLVITQDNLRSQQDTLNLTRERFRAGISSDLDVARAEAQVSTTYSTIPTLEQQIRQLIHALGVLTGKDPDALSSTLTPPQDLLLSPPALPLGLPSDLLRNRPDVRKAERQLAASTARIGVATADLFPRFSMTGTYAFEATKANKLFTDPSNFLSIGPSVSWPIFDAGRIRANIEVQNSLQEQALDNYEQTVLTAMQNVEDSLIAYDREQARRVALAQSVASNRRAVDLSTQLYSRGLIDFLSVLDAQRSLFIAQDLLVRSDTIVSENLIALYKALGGGWDQTPPPPPYVDASEVMTPNHQK
jgi:NodT family efflux transporter outer membrane factor (OMF) lipoprotein